MDGSNIRLGLASVVHRLAKLGFEPLVTELTRSTFNIPVMRVLCPGLEQEPSTLRGERISAAIEDTGAGPGLRSAISPA
jgi:hypothetical protein